MVALGDILSRREEILRVAARHGAHHVRVFGSVVRGEAGKNSDVDFLVRLDLDRSLLDHIALIRELEGLMGCRVDVVTEDDLHHAIRARVLAEGVPL
ncbi:MAG TPA: nucleotidyltransferase family protein [Phycisphaerae bacterium]|nr:nucleotidyltransferase family protein [Phycisphaerae bacterium]HUS44976.1 nucleotidyltransferase family protein [Phycisphaerae bacterium]